MLSTAWRTSGIVWRLLASVALLAVTWGVAGAIVVVLLWPAAWGQPFETVWRALDFSVRLGGTPHGPGNFFLGQAVDAPGPMFYAVALALRLGPATTVGLMALLLVGAPRRYGFAVWSLLVYVGLFLLLLTVASKKVDRYLLPVLPALDVLAAVGWWEAARRLAQLGGRLQQPRAVATSVPADAATPVEARRLAASAGGEAWMLAASATAEAPVAARSRARDGEAASGVPASLPRTLTVFLALGVAALQVWPLLAVGRYPLAAYNPLFGGARAAELAMPVGWGDGLDVAADRIRELGGGAPMTTAIWYPLWVNFQAHAPGPVVTERRLADADVYVDYVHARQRGTTPRQLVGRRPDAIVQIAGVDYARIYRLR